MIQIPIHFQDGYIIRVIIITMIFLEARIHAMFFYALLYARCPIVHLTDVGAGAFLTLCGNRWGFVSNH